MTVSGPSSNYPQHEQVYDGRQRREDQGPEPDRSGVRSGPERVNDRQHPDRDAQAVKLAPSPGSDTAAQVEAGTDQQEEVPRQNPRGSESGAIAHRERDRDASKSRLQPPIAQQGEPVKPDGAERSQRDMLVKPCDGPLQAWAPQHVRRHRETHQHRQRDQDERDQAGRAADQPPDVVERLPFHAATGAANRSSIRPIVSTLPLS